MSRYPGTAINSPANGISLRVDTCASFNKLFIYFDPTSPETPTYTVHEVHHVLEQRRTSISGYARTITFRSGTEVDLLEPDLLAIHGACCLVAYKAGAVAAGIEFIRDIEDGVVEADGSTQLGSLVESQLGGEHGHEPESKQGEVGA